MTSTAIIAQNTPSQASKVMKRGCITCRHSSQHLIFQSPASFLGIFVSHLGCSMTITPMLIMLQPYPNANVPAACYAAQSCQIRVIAPITLDVVFLNQPAFLLTPAVTRQMVPITYFSIFFLISLTSTAPLIFVCSMTSATNP